MHTKSVDGVSSTAALFFPCLLFLKTIACFLVKAPEKLLETNFFSLLDSWKSAIVWDDQSCYRRDPILGERGVALSACFLGA